MRRNVVHVLVFALAVAWFVGPVTAANYSIYELQPLPAVTQISGGNGISNTGQVVGSSGQSDYRGTRWTPAPGCPVPPATTPIPNVELPPLPGHSGAIAIGVNDSSYATGYSGPGSNDRPVAWKPDNTAVALPLMGGSRGSARAINNNCTVVGLVVNGGEKPARWTTSDGNTWTGEYMDMLPGARNSWPNAINNNDYSAGFSEDTLVSPYQKAVVWRPNKSVFALPHPAGMIGSQAIGMNDSTLVVGKAWPSSQSIGRAAIWDTDTLTAELLPMLSEGASGDSRAYDINNSGLVVGNSFTSQGQRATIWEKSAGTYLATDLNTLIDAPGWDLVVAVGINDSGWISGTGYYYGVERGFLLVPEPASLCLLALGGLAVMRRKRR